MKSASARLTLAVVVVAAVALAACGGQVGQSTTRASHSSGVFGIVLISGGRVSDTDSPRPLPGGFVASPPAWGAPFTHGSVRVVAKTGTNAGRVVATVKPTAQGLFRVALPPGRYVLWLVPRNSSEPTTVVVRAGADTRVELFKYGF